MPLKGLIDFLIRVESKFEARHAKRDQSETIQQVHDLRLQQYEAQSRVMKEQEANSSGLPEHHDTLLRNGEYCALGHRDTQPDSQEDAHNLLSQRPDNEHLETSASHTKKKCWFGKKSKQSQSPVKNTASTNDEPMQITTDGRQSRCIKNSTSRMSLWRFGKVPAGMAYWGIEEEGEGRR